MMNLINKSLHLICTLFILLLFNTSLLANAQETTKTTENPWYMPIISIENAYNFANINGYLQTPVGGEPGLSDYKRPSFEELGIHDTNYTSTELNAIFNKKYNFYFERQNINPSGSTKLNQKLISHGYTLLANTPISVNSKFNVSRLGFRYLTHRDQNKLIIAPELEATLLSFLYEYSTPKINSHRGFNSIGARLGLFFSLMLTDHLSISGEAAKSILRTNQQMLSIAGKISYDIIKSSKFTCQIFLAEGYEDIDFEDHQTLPNHEKITLLPYKTIGIKLITPSSEIVIPLNNTAINLLTKILQ